ncbi:MAG: DeoR family transcriptional regulator, partial [Veillonellaceae bacterium]|nr:DeoR family transcriptional regulator [Veillonellaceae bacterium]
MLGIERRRKIMDKLNEERKVYVSELAKLFGVTEETIRRDLEKLEGKDLLRRSYGGAVLNEHT